MQYRDILRLTAGTLSARVKVWIDVVGKKVKVPRFVKSIVLVRRYSSHFPLLRRSLRLLYISHGLAERASSTISTRRQRDRGGVHAASRRRKQRICAGAAVPPAPPLLSTVRSRCPRLSLLSSLVFSLSLSLSLPPLSSFSRLHTRVVGSSCSRESDNHRLAAFSATTLTFIKSNVQWPAARSENVENFRTCLETSPGPP